MSLGTAVIVGVGPGLGLELARIFGNAGHILGARVAADAVLPKLRDGRGTLLFTGGGYALHPSKKFASLSVGKAGLRAYVEVLHDQLAGTGVHATSITITASIGSAPRFEPAEIAKAYLELGNQAETEWQHELVYSPSCSLLRLGSAWGLGCRCGRGGWSTGASLVGAG